MLSSMSYTPDQTEVFARSLRSRLQTLSPQQNSPPEEEAAGQGNNDTLRHILERSDHLVASVRGFPFPGTTFPPGRCAQFDLLRAKYHSETDLTPQNNIVSSSSLSSTAKSTNSTLSEEEDNQEHHPDVQLDDSDLFFDFDINSPQFEDEDIFTVDPIINHNPAIQEQEEEEEEEDSSPPELEDVKSNSRRYSEGSALSDDHSSLPLTENSTAFGSTSSGLYSDTEAIMPKSVSDEEEHRKAGELLEGMSVNPEDWMRNQDNIRSLVTGQQTITTPAAAAANNVDSSASSSSVTPVAMDSPDDDESSSAKMEAVAAKLSSPERNSSDNNGLTITIGNREKSIASSKLSALISLLDSTKEERSPMPQRTKTIKTSSPTQPSSPTKMAPDAAPDLSVTCPTPCGTFGSPANFSFLAGGVSRSCADMKQLEGQAPALERSLSASMLNDIHKSKEEMDKEASLKAQQAAASSATDTSDVDEENKARYRRCSSLKSGKTPPGTPGRQKIVRFADVFGLDLADIKTFLDEVPKVPKSAFQDLKDAELSDIDSDSGSERHFQVQPPSGPPAGMFVSPSPSTPVFSALFTQPSGTNDFFNRLRDRKVLLESAFMCNLNTIKGIVRVVNLDFHKRVTVKYTLDEWATTQEVEGTYISNSCDGFSDKFEFLIDLTAIKGQVGKTMHFCLCYTCSANEYWDNNNTRNYTFQCFAGSGTRASPSRSMPIEAASSSSSSTNNNNNNASGGGGGARRGGGHQAVNTFSHSPSAFAEEPWHHYL